MTTAAATRRYTAFEIAMMKDVVEEHGVAKDHTEFCCNVAKVYAERLANLSLTQEIKPVEEEQARKSHSGNYARKPSPGPRQASEKQIAFMQSLMNDRECSEQERGAWTVMMENGITSSEASRIIDRLLKRAQSTSQRDEAPAKKGRPASEKQINLIKKLADVRNWGPAATRFQEQLLRKVLKDEPIELRDASALIEFLFTCEEMEVGQEGVYFFEGEYYKVQRAIHGSGRLYSKKFDRETQSWDRGGRLSLLTPEYKLTAEQASEFGQLYGQCVVCSLPLTDERSIDHGYGKKCAENNGWPY